MTATPGPGSAPPRPDLGWLRHRRARRTVEYVKPPDTAPPPQPAPPPGPVDLDLSTPEPPSGPARPHRTRPRALAYPRISRGSTVVLTEQAPTVTLTRLQSGIGQLRTDFTRGPAAAGDAELGLVCQRADGLTQVVQALGDATSTGERPLPLVRLESGAVVLDLRQVRSLGRALLYAHSPSVAVCEWDAQLALTCQDGSRVEAPLGLPPLSGTIALLTVYNVHGELVLRAEREAFAGPPEMAAEAYGFRYGWLDGRFPSR